MQARKKYDEYLKFDDDEQATVGEYAANMALQQQCDILKQINFP